MNERQIRANLERLRRMQQATLKGRPFLIPEGTITRLDIVERRLLEAVKRDETGSTLPDGYPTGNVGSGGEDAPQSSTEAAALSGYRLNSDGEGSWGNYEQDRHHELTTAAAEALDRAAAALDTLMSQLDAIDRLATIQRTDPSGHCQACGRWVEGTANDRLRAGYCDADRKAWERAGRPDRPTFERQRRSSAA